MNIKALSIIASLHVAAAMLHAGDVSGGSMQAGEADDTISAPQSGTGAPGVPSAVVSGSDGIVMFKLAGDGQGVAAGQWTPASLEVGVWRESGLEPLINVPVDFSLAEGGGWLAKTPGLDAGSSVQILTDIDGIAQVWHRQPDMPDVQSIITASTLGKSVTFTTYSIAPSDATSSGQAAGTGSLTAETQAGALSQSGTKTPNASSAARLSQKSLLMSLATAQGTRRFAKSLPQDTASKSAAKTAPDIDLPDEYFAYPSDHPLGRMQRGMILYAAAGKARELRAPGRTLLLAAGSKDWLLRALEDEGRMSAASAARCHHYLGRIAELYEGKRAEALRLYRIAGEKDATRKHAKSVAERIEHSKK